MIDLNISFDLFVASIIKLHKFTFSLLSKQIEVCGMALPDNLFPHRVEPSTDLFHTIFDGADNRV